MINLKKEIEYNITATKCWECTSHATGSHGYPRVMRDNIQYEIYRYMYLKHKGIIPEGYVVRHKCDNSKCINPAHLIIGTHNDNVQDRVARNRSAKGIQHGRAKLTEMQVIEIYLDTTSTQQELANKFRVSKRAISLIKNGINWRHITSQIHSDSCNA